MASDGKIYFRIRPEDPNRGLQDLDAALRRLDEYFTTHLTGGVGNYDHDRKCAEVWLLDREEEPAARRAIADHGFRVVMEESVEGKIGEL